MALSQQGYRGALGPLDLGYLDDVAIGEKGKRVERFCELCGTTSNDYHMAAAVDVYCVIALLQIARRARCAAIQHATMEKDVKSQQCK